MKRYRVEFTFDDEIVYKENNIQPDDVYEEVLTAIKVALEHFETLSEIKIKRISNK